MYLIKYINLIVKTDYCTVIMFDFGQIVTTVDWMQTKMNHELVSVSFDGNVSKRICLYDRECYREIFQVLI